MAGSPTHSGSQLQFTEDVELVQHVRHDEDGAIAGVDDYKVGTIDLAAEGTEGCLHLINGTVINGHIVYVRKGESPLVYRLGQARGVSGDLADQLRPAAAALDQVAALEGLIGDWDTTYDQHSVPEGFAAGVTKLVRERGSDYGTPAENHGLTAELWGSWLSRRLGIPLKLTAEDVCMLNILQKSSRLAYTTKNDSWFDIAGFTENVAMLRQDQRNRHDKE